MPEIQVVYVYLLMFVSNHEGNILSVSIARSILGSLCSFAYPDIVEGQKGFGLLKYDINIISTVGRSLHDYAFRTVFP